MFFLQVDFVGWGFSSLEAIDGFRTLKLLTPQRKLWVAESLIFDELTSMRLMAAYLVCAVLPLVSFAATSGGWMFEVTNGGAIILSYSGPGGALIIPSQLGGASSTSYW